MKLKRLAEAFRPARKGGKYGTTLEELADSPAMGSLARVVIDYMNSELDLAGSGVSLVEVGEALEGHDLEEAFREIQASGHEFFLDSGEYIVADLIRDVVEVVLTEMFEQLPELS